MQRQTAVTAHFSSEQLLLFTFTLCVRRDVRAARRTLSVMTHPASLPGIDPFSAVCNSAAVTTGSTKKSRYKLNIPSHFVYKKPSKHKTFAYYLYNVEPTSKPLIRRCTHVIQFFCVCWEYSRPNSAFYIYFMSPSIIHSIFCVDCGYFC